MKAFKVEGPFPVPVYWGAGGKVVRSSSKAFSMRTRTCATRQDATSLPCVLAGA